MGRERGVAKVETRAPLLFIHTPYSRPVPMHPPASVTPQCPKLSRSQHSKHYPKAVLEGHCRAVGAWRGRYNRRKAARGHPTPGIPTPTQEPPPPSPPLPHGPARSFNLDFGGVGDILPLAFFALVTECHRFALRPTSGRRGSDAWPRKEERKAAV